jgi:hypothetical protein
MDNFGQNLTKRIMRRVYAVWFLRKAGPVLAGAFLSLGFALWLTAKEFFVAKIIENFTASIHSGNISSVFSFIGSALYNAPFLPMAIIGFSLGLSLILAYRLIRNFFQLTIVRI